MKSDFLAKVHVTGVIELDPQEMRQTELVTSRGNRRPGTPTYLMVEYTFDAALGWLCTNLVVVARYVTQDGRSSTPPFRSRVMRSVDGQDAHLPHTADLPPCVGPHIDKHRPTFTPPVALYGSRP